MVAQAAPPVSSAAYHCPTELLLNRVDDVHNTVTFTAPSKSKPGTTNTVSLDVESGETFCDCRASECGHRCWHAELVTAAWQGTPAWQEAARFNGEQLARAGKKAANMCAVYRKRSWRVLPDDAAMLVACRDIWRQRFAAEVAEMAPHAADNQAEDAA